MREHGVNTRICASGIAEEILEVFFSGASPPALGVPENRFAARARADP